MSIFQIEVVIWSIDISWHYRGKLTTMLLIVGPEKDYKQIISIFFKFHYIYIYTVHSIQSIKDKHVSEHMRKSTFIL